MPNTVPAADIGLPTINRRSALAKLGLGLAASTSIASTAIAAPVGVSPELLRLIEDHRAAYDAFDAAIGRKEQALAAYRAIKPEPLAFVDIFNRPPGHSGREELPLDMSLGLDECKKRVMSNLDWSWHMGRAGEGCVTPKRLKQIKAAQRGAERDAIADVEAYFARDEAARQSSGIAGAELERDRALDAEDEAMRSLCSYRCRTTAEIGARASYLSVLGADNISETHMQALLQSSCAEA